MEVAVVVVAMAVAEMEVEVEVDVVVITDATVKSVTNVTKSGISHANARKMLIVVIVAMVSFSSEVFLFYLSLILLESSIVCFGKNQS